MLRTSAPPKEVEIVAAPVVSTVTCPLPPVIVAVPLASFTVILPKRLRKSRAPLMPLTSTEPLLSFTKVSPVASRSSMLPKELLSFEGPVCDTVSEPWLLSMSERPRTPVVVTLPKLFLTVSYASDGIAMS